MEDAETYDSYLVPAIFEPWSRELIKRAQVWKGDSVLDVCTGTGIVACRIAGTGAAVTAIDISPELLAVCSVLRKTNAPLLRKVPFRLRSNEDPADRRVQRSQQKWRVEFICRG